MTKYLDYNALKRYDEKIKEKIKSDASLPVTDKTNSKTTSLKRIEIVSNYPTSLEDDVLYLKVEQ